MHRFAIGWIILVSPPHVWHSVWLMFLYGALDSHPFFPLHVASGRCFLSAAAAGALAGVVSAFAEPSGWCAGAVLNVASCAVFALAAPSSWRIWGCAGCCETPRPTAVRDHRPIFPGLNGQIARYSHSMHRGDFVSCLYTPVPSTYQCLRQDPHPHKRDPHHHVRGCRKLRGIQRLERSDMAYARSPVNKAPGSLEPLLYGKTCWSVRQTARIGRMWRDMEGRGRTWRDMEGYGGIWRDIEKYGRGAWQAMGGRGGMWRDVGQIGGMWRNLEGRRGMHVHVERVGGTWWYRTNITDCGILILCWVF